MNEWIELKKILADGKVNKFYIEPYNIDAVEATGTDSCKVWNYTSETQYSMAVAEPAEEVLEKIKQTQERPPALVERFTRDEYCHLSVIVEKAIAEDEKKNYPHDILDSIIDKLKDIIKEYK